MTTTAKKVALGMTGAVLLALSTVEAAQALTVFDNRASFTSAVGSLPNIGFEGLAPAGGFTDFATTGLTQSGVNFSSVRPPNTPPTVNSLLFVVDPAFNPDGYNWGSGALLIGGLRGTINVTLPGGINVVGTDFSTILPYASDLTVTLSTGVSRTVSALNFPNRAFIGFISETPISSLSFTSLDGYPQLDNFTFGSRIVEQSTPIPTPALLPGLIGLGVAAWKRRKSAVSQSEVDS